jgi:hypothetical protein
MAQFNYFMLPSGTMPTYYYLNMPSQTSLDRQHVETATNIASDRNIRVSHLSSLELSEGDHLAAGYERKKRAWTAE